MAETQSKGIDIKGIKPIPPTPLTEAEIKSGLRTLLLGRKVYSLASVDSTNTLAFRLAEAGAEGGTLVVAEQQTRGRGRMGREWHSPSEVGLWASLILRPRLLSHQISQLTLLAGLAVARAIRTCTGLPAVLKWPNDVLIGQRKVCGILTEIRTSGKNVEYCVLGFGVNVNQSTDDFPPTLRSTATSLKVGLGREVSRVKVLQHILTELEGLYLRWEQQGFDPILEQVKGLSVVLGKRVTVEQGLLVYRGKATDIDREGALILELEEGGFQRIIAGDVSLREES